MSGQVNVEVNAAPQVDLTAILDDLREQYEASAAKSRKELEAWFQAKVHTQIPIRSQRSKEKSPNSQHMIQI
jgi:hypothetical protein